MVIEGPGGAALPRCGREAPALPLLLDLPVENARGSEEGGSTFIIHLMFVWMGTSDTSEVWYSFVCSGGASEAAKQMCSREKALWPIAGGQLDIYDLPGKLWGAWVVAFRPWQGR